MSIFDENLISSPVIKFKTLENAMKLDLNKIYQKDCLKVLASLPDESVDLIVSSPPYNIGKKYEKKTTLDIYIEGQTKVLAECSRVLKRTGSIFWQVGSFSDRGMIIPLDIKFFPVLEKLGLLPINRIIWVRQHGLHASKKFSCRHETILWFAKSKDYYFDLDPVRVPQKWQNKKKVNGPSKGELSCNPDGKNPSDIWLFRNVKHNHEEQTIHPCQFPEDMIARIVLAASPEGGVVFDPYMGTGTLAVVAQENNRNFVGAEIDPIYYEVSQRRLSGLPDENGSFANLKCLRDYVERTGENIEKFRFDVQTGKRASERSKSKIFDEDYHSEEYMRRLQYEEDAFSLKRKGLEVPEDINLNGKAQQKLHTSNKFQIQGQPKLFLEEDV